jgi:hypothetical protein
MNAVGHRVGAMQWTIIPMAPECQGMARHAQPHHGSWSFRCLYKDGGKCAIVNNMGGFSLVVSHFLRWAEIASLIIT